MWPRYITIRNTLSAAGCETCLHLSVVGLCMNLLGADIIHGTQQTPWIMVFGCELELSADLFVRLHIPVSVVHMWMRSSP